ncbi:MAG: phage shock protein operon transcriptional activator [Gammaproteobacteria bacterium]|nr:phage shock protein operon transcriptional activator [Gammaproteobacteria bacterium]
MTPERVESPDPIVGEADNFLAVLEQVSRLAPLDKPVLIVGERGTGKELIAARLHYLSERWQRNFVKFNCAALHEDLLESELFGHVAGAYTGATRARVGRFELADGGTLFLDEISSMSLRLQEKLLRVVEYHEYERVGSSATESVDVRLVAAANVDLPSLAHSGRFRADLLDRLSFDVLTVPPLRARPGDIPLLARRFSENMTRELGREYFAGFSRDAEASLRAYPWPGNVRELRNVVERAVYRLERTEQIIEAIEFDPFASPYRLAAVASPVTPIERLPATGTAPGLVAAGIADERLTAAAPDAAPAAQQALVEGDPELPCSFDALTAAFAQRLLQAALRRTRFNQRKAAALLGLSYHQFRGQLRKHAIPPRW